MRALVIHDENILLASDSQLQPTLYQLFLTNLAKTIGIACRTIKISGCLWKHSGSVKALPLLRHSILTWFPRSGRVNASKVGAKNMASSSGCAISSSMRLFCNVGKDAPRVLVYIQKTKMRTGTDAHTVQFMVNSGIKRAP